MTSRPQSTPGRGGRGYANSRGGRGYYQGYQGSYYHDSMSSYYQGSTSFPTPTKPQRSYKETLNTEEQKMIENPVKDPIIFIEDTYLKWQSAPYEIGKRYFEMGSFFPTKAGMNRARYEAILKDTASVEFTHNFRNHDNMQSAYAFSKAKFY